MAAALAAIISWFARILPAAFSLSRLTGWLKGLLSAGLFTVGVPLAINWGAFKVAENFAPALFDTLGLSPTSIQITGLGAWVATQLQLPLCLSVFMGFVAKKAVMKLTQMGGVFSKFSTNRYN